MVARKAYGWEEDLQSEAVPMGDLEAPVSLDDIQDIEAPEMLAVNPLDELDPNSVPPEVRVDAPVARPVEDTRLRDAAARDRRRQKSADVRAYFLAAGRREAPNLRNVGTSYSDAARAEIASQPKAVDPLERELMAFRILQAKKGLEPKAVNPLDDDMKRQQIKTQAALEALYGRGNQPKPEKPMDPLRADLDRAEIDRRKAAAEKLRRQPAAKPVKPLEPGRGEAGGLPAGYTSSTATKEQRQEFARLVEQDAKNRAGASRIRSLLGKVGAAQRMSPKWLQSDEAKAILTRLKSEASILDMGIKETAKLGVLAGPDMGIIRSIIADPTSVASAAVDLPAQLDAIEAWGGDAVTAGSMARNIIKGDYKKQQSSGRVFTKDGKQYMEHPNGDLEELD